jgi:hypothetical protein
LSSCGHHGSSSNACNLQGSKIYIDAKIKNRFLIENRFRLAAQAAAAAAAAAQEGSMVTFICIGKSRD